MKNELKTCPFCGGKATIIDTGNYFPEVFYRVICERSCVMQSTLYKEKAKAIEAWNRRTKETKL